MTRPEDQPRGGDSGDREHWYRPQRPEDLVWAPGSEPGPGRPEHSGHPGDQPEGHGFPPGFEQQPVLPTEQGQPHDPGHLHAQGQPQEQGHHQWPPAQQQPYAQFPPPGEQYQPGPGEAYHPGPPPAEDHTHLSFPEPEPPQRFVLGPGHQEPGFPPPPSPVLPGPDPMRPPASAYHPASAPYHQDSAPYHQDSAPYHPGSDPYPSQEPVPPYPMSQSSAPHPMSHGSAAYPMSQSSAPYAQASAPHPMSQASASHSQPSATYPPQPGPGATAWPPAGQRSNRSRKNSQRAIAALVIGAVALAGVLLFGISQFQRANQSTATGPAASRELSRPAPPGWSRRFVWSAEIPSTATIAVIDNRVAYVDAAGALHVLNADTGQPVLTSTSNSLTKDAKPFLAVTQGVPVGGIIDGTTLLLWRLDTPGSEPRTITLANKGKLYAQGGGLLITTGSEYWVVNAAGALAPVTLPPDHVALAATPDGNLLSSPPRGGWTINSANPGTAPREVRPERTPDGTVGEIQVAWSSRGVIAAWGDTADPARRTVALYDADTGKLLAQGSLAADVVKAGLPLTVSPKREFASAGPLLARLSDGKTEVVDRWSTIMSDTKNLYGSRDGQKMFWNGELQPMEMDAKAVVPWGMSDARYAIVMDPVDASRVRLGALAEG